MTALQPTGFCWCGCGTRVSRRAFFTTGHDRKSEAAILALKYEGSIASFVHAHGFGPEGRNLDLAFQQWQRENRIR